MRILTLTWDFVTANIITPSGAFNYSVYDHLIFALFSAS
jgi:hypothetical protein